MKESTTYQVIVAEGRDEGRVEQTQRLLLLLGERALKAPPPAEARTRIEATDDLARLEEWLLTATAGRASTWPELLGLDTPTPRRRGRRSSS